MTVACPGCGLPSGGRSCGRSTSSCRKFALVWWYCCGCCSVHAAASCALVSAVLQDANPAWRVAAAPTGFETAGGPGAAVGTPGTVPLVGTGSWLVRIAAIVCGQWAACHHCWPVLGLVGLLKAETLLAEGMSPFRGCILVAGHLGSDTHSHWVGFSHQ